MRNRLAIVLASTALAVAVAAPGQDAAPQALVAGNNGVPVPKRTKFVLPEYPEAAQAQGLRGIVILELTIGVDGAVTAARVVRSVPPFDEAALAAVRQWTYEPVRVDGRAMPVKLTVPITFALKLPELQRGAGVPELRQGGIPVVMGAASGQTARVVATVTLDAGGVVVDAAVRAGESPWAEAVLNALRTWRFAVTPEDGIVQFEMTTDFVPQPIGAPKVSIKLDGAQRLTAAEAAAATAPGTAPAAAPAAVPAPSTPPVAAPSPDGPTAAPREPSTLPPPIATPPVTMPPVAAPSVPAPPVTTPPVATPPVVAPTPAPPSTPSPSASPSASRPGPDIEVIRGGVQPPPPAPVVTQPPAPGVSAVRDVELAIGVPDLSKGRRPVVPPFARIAGTSGSVEVRFAVDSGGVTSIQEVTGTEELKEAAKQTVQSWSFRRTSLERVYLVATFTYEGVKARAQVKPFGQ